VVEGWYGQPFPRPLERTREYVHVVRQVLAREGPVVNDGPHYPLPYPGGTGLGKPLKPIVHPLRRDIPIVLGAEGPKNVALAAEIADGWFPIFFSPEHMGEFAGALHEGFGRPGARRSPEDFEVIAMCPVAVGETSSVPPMPSARCWRSTSVAWEHARPTSTSTSSSGWVSGPKRLPSSASTSRATSRMPLLPFPPPWWSRSPWWAPDKIRHDLAAWQESMATTLLVSGSIDTLRLMAELVM